MKKENREKSFANFEEIEENFYKKIFLEFHVYVPPVYEKSRK